MGAWGGVFLGDFSENGYEAKTFQLNENGRE
jgi:hypothetical protein